MAALTALQEREQISLAVTRNGALKRGDKWFLVSARWWREWSEFVDFEETGRLPGERPRPGPIDNSPLLEDGKLRRGLVEDQDYILLPRSAWRLLKLWYNGGPKVSRRVFAFGDPERQQLRIALFPAEIDVHTCGADGKPDQLTKVVPFPTAISVFELKDTLATMCYSAPHRLRLWVFRNGDWELMRELSRTLEEYGITMQNTAEQNKVMIESLGGQNQWPRESPYNGIVEMEVVNTSSTARDSGPPSSYWSRPDGTPGTPPAPGLVGLQNLGNTCFMNSALQCLSHTPALSTFFLQLQFRPDINTDNPLGMKGQLAEEYYEMLSLIWSGEYRSVAPGRFKSSLGKFAPQFSGYQQQDSQELLAFLLDGLHEDLNRIKKKPYVESVESNGRPDDIVAKEAWEAHLKRNKSVIVDLFQGQLKSTVTCPDCGKVSITFDPFMYLSVPLPARLDRVIPVSFVYLNKAKRTKLAIRIAKSARVAELRAAIAETMGVPSEKLQVCEVYRARVFDAYPDDRELTRISDRDDVFAYEIVAMPPETPAVAVTPAAETPAPASAPAPAPNAPVADKSADSAPAPPSRNNSNADISAEATASGEVATAVPTPAAPKNPNDIEIVDVQTLPAPVTSTSTATTTSTSTAVIPYVERSPVIIRVYQIDAEPKAIAYPLLLSYTETPTAARVHADITTGIFSRFAVLERLPTPNPLVYKCLRNGYAGQCARCTTENCRGCIVAADDHTPLKLIDKMDAIVVEWLAASAPALDESKITSQDMHATAIQYEAELRRPIALSECFDLFTKAEKLAPEDMWYCSNCKDHRQAFKKLELWSLPQYLVIHLKRFQFSRSLRDKIPSLVIFPMQNLDLTPFAGGQHAPAAQQVPYDLYAVSNHSGDLGGGHYTASVYAHDKWWDCNDSSVGGLDPGRVVCEEAYVLFYKRRDAPSQVVLPSKEKKEEEKKEEEKKAEEKKDDEKKQEEVKEATKATDEEVKKEDKMEITPTEDKRPSEAAAPASV